MPGYKSLGPKMPDIVQVSRDHDPGNFFEKINPKIRREEIYRIDKNKFTEAGEAGEFEFYDQMINLTYVNQAVKFYRDRGFTIKLVDEGNLFLVTAEKLED